MTRKVRNFLSAGRPRMLSAMNVIPGPPSYLPRRGVMMALDWNQGGAK